MRKRTGVRVGKSLICLGVALLLLGAPGFLNAKTVLTFPQMTPKGYFYDLLAEKMNEIVSKKTNGEVEIKSYPGGTLGNDQELQAGIKMGTVDLYMMDMGALGMIEGGKDFNIMFLPYLFRDQDHFYAFLKSKTLQSMIFEYESKSGIKILGYGMDRGPRQITTSKTAVWTADDLKGVKIRVPKIKTLMEAFATWGANPTPINFSELFQAFQSGVVDGQDNGLDQIESAHFQEVQKYLMLTEHVRSGSFVLTSQETWEKKLNDEQRKIMLEALEESSKQISSLMWANEKEAVKRLAHQGMRVIIPDVVTFQEKAKAIGPRLDGELWRKGLYDEIQTIK